MAQLSDAVRSALGYWWNLISDAARAGFTATDTIQLAQQVAEDTGAKLSFQDNTAISTLYGFARREVNAAAALGAAPGGAPITSDMVSVPPYARDIAERNAYPIYHVKFEYTYLDQNGDQQTAVRTSARSLTLATDTDALQDQVEDDGEGFAAKYGHQFISATPIAILAV